MKKKLLIFLTNVCLACGIGGTVTACEPSEAKVNLVEFPATATENVVLGDIYKASRVVMDENGNAYKLSVSVADSKGNKVSVVDGEFLIKDLEGYTITYKAYVNDGQKKTVNLRVSDQDGPDIFMQGTLGYIKVGEEIEFPDFKFKDLGGVQSSAVKLYYVSDGEQELALKEENGVKSFTPTQTGKYLLRAEAKDNAGNEKKREYSFRVLDKSVVYSPIIDGIGGVIKEGGGSDTAVSYADEDKEREGAYQGSYVSLTATAAAGATLRIRDTQGAGERLASLKEEGYNSVKVWVKAVPFEETMQTYTFNWLANCPTTAVTVSTNEWTQVTLPMDAFESYCGKAKNETWLMYGLFGQAGGLSELCLGDVLADKYVLSENVIYNPVELGASGMRKEGGGTASGISFVSADVSREADYKGGYISYVRTGDAGGPANTLDFAPNDTLQERITNLKNAGNNLVKIWVKATTNDVAKTEYNITWCASAGAPVVAVKTNEWTQISLPMSVFDTYYANESSGVGAWLVNVALGQEQVLSEFCLGEITAEKYTVAENVIFSPTESGTAIMTRAGESVTSVISYVGADASREGDYKDGYISYVQNGASAANTLDFLANDTLKERITNLKNAGNSHVKIWVKATTKEAATETYTFTWCAGAGAPVLQIKANEWTQVSLPMTVFEKYYATELANAGNAWLVNVSLGMSGTLSEFCLGEITAEKYIVAENVFYDPAELGTTGLTRAGNSNTSVIAYVDVDETRDGYQGGYISYVQNGTSAANTLDLLRDDNIKTRITALKAKGNNYVKVWVKATTNDSAVEEYTFQWCAGAGQPNVTIKTNEWVQAELPMSVFEGYYDLEMSGGNAWLLNVSLGASGTLSEFCIGNITAEKYEFASDTLYSPIESGLAGLAVTNGGSATTKVSYNGGDESDEIYSGRYVSIASTNGTTGNTTFYFNKTDALTSRLTNFVNAGRTTVKVWMKVESSAETVTLTWFAGPSGNSLTATVKTNEWTQVELPIANFKAEYEHTSAHWTSNFTWSQMTKVCLGEVTAEALADNVLYTPSEKNAAGLYLTSASGGACTATYHAGDLKNTSYQGAYVEIASSKGTAGLTTFYFNKTNALTSRLTNFVNAGRTTVKVWMKVESSAETVTLTWFAGPSGNSLTATVKTNEWTQVELPIANFKAEYEFTSGHWTSNFTWTQMTKVCLGEVTVA